MVWNPNVTVAAVVERDGRFLFVDEETDDGRRFNQPAGHLEEGETLIEAVVRETLEETRYRFRPEFLIGVYSWRHERKDITYLRFAFGGELVGFDADRALDQGIVEAVWLSPDELAARADRHRSPLVARCVADYRAGRRFPLDLITYHP